MFKRKGVYVGAGDYLWKGEPESFYVFEVGGLELRRGYNVATRPEEIAKKIKKELGKEKLRKWQIKLETKGPPPSYRGREKTTGIDVDENLKRIKITYRCESYRGLTKDEREKLKKALFSR